MMLANITQPTKQQILLFSAVDRELSKRTTNLNEDARKLIVARFVDSYDFSNTAIAHKSAGGWAKMLIENLNLN